MCITILYIIIKHKSYKRLKTRPFANGHTQCTNIQNMTEQNGLSLYKFLVI